MFERILNWKVGLGVCWVFLSKEYDGDKRLEGKNFCLFRVAPTEGTNDIQWSTI